MPNMLWKHKIYGDHNFPAISKILSKKTAQETEYTIVGKSSMCAIREAVMQEKMITTQICRYLLFS